MAKKILDRDEFRAWLEKHGPRGVGRASISCGCPIAQYLYETTKTTAIVEVHSFKVKKRWRPMPGWAKAFVRKIDTTFSQRKVSGSQALRVLDIIEIGK